MRNCCADVLCLESGGKTYSGKDVRRKLIAGECFPPAQRNGDTWTTRDLMAVDGGGGGGGRSVHDASDYITVPSEEDLGLSEARKLDLEFCRKGNS